MALEIEVEPERLEASMDKAVRRLSQRVRIPGFRPGKAPRHVIERTLGRSALVQEALEQLLPDVYSETIAAESIDAIGQPSFELKSMEPLVVAATVPVRPTIDLKEYTALRAPKPEAAVAEEQVEAALTNLRRRYATLDPVDRPLQWGDTVRADVTVSVDGQAEPHVEEGAEFAVLEGTTISLPGFLDHLIGLERGGPYEIAYELSADFVSDELAGKAAHYTVTIHEVKQEELPPFDDDFAKSLGEDFETAAAVRERIEQNVQAQAEAQAVTAYQEEVLDLLLATAEIDYPEVLVDNEVARMIDQESNHASHTQEGLDKWLQQVGRTEDEVRETLRPRADLAVRRALVLNELAQREGITVGEDEIETEVDRMVEQWFAPQTAAQNDDQREMIRGMIANEESRASMRHQLLTTATLGRLTEITAQDEAGDGDAPRPRGTRRRRGRAVDGANSDDAVEEAAEAAPEAEEKTE